MQHLTDSFPGYNPDVNIKYCLLLSLFVNKSIVKNYSHEYEKFLNN